MRFCKLPWWSQASGYLGGNPLNHMGLSVVASWLRWALQGPRYHPCGPRCACPIRCAFRASIHYAIVGGLPFAWSRCDRLLSHIVALEPVANQGFANGCQTRTATVVVAARFAGAHAAPPFPIPNCNCVVPGVVRNIIETESLYRRIEKSRKRRIRFYFSGLLLTRHKQTHIGP